MKLPIMKKIQITTLPSAQCFSGMVGCLSHGRGGTTVQLGCRWNSVNFSVPLQDMVLHFYWHCQSQASCNQVLSPTMLTKTCEMTLYSHYMPVYCHALIFCMHKLCTWVSYYHLWFKIRHQLCTFASTVSSSIELSITPPFNSYVFIIGIDNHAYRCMDSNIK